MTDEVAKAIRDTLISSKESANIVDVVTSLAWGLRRISSSICVDAAPGQDASGGSVVSLTEAVMGITAGLFQVAAAIESIAANMEDRR